ncbi:UNVERIFIED_CONTAM: hypothetical protein Cloal_1743 [Acetivibrio alkalicellulosi]
MNENTVSIFTKVHTTVSFIFMIVINILANLIPFNGITTGQVSDSFPNLFAPAGITFSIWAVIYFLLAAYIIYQFNFFISKDSTFNPSIPEKIGILFSITSIANTAWIFAWHYLAIALSLILIIVILICLIIINHKLKQYKLSLKEKIFVQIPFSIYFGWITVATIANVTTYLVSIDWNGFGIAPWIWTIFVLIVGLFIGGLTIIKNQDFSYGLVITWAYIGILIKHTSASGFSGQYPLIITVLIVSIVLLLITNVYILAADKEKLKSLGFLKRN